MGMPRKSPIFGTTYADYPQWLISYVGRRTIYVTGQALLCGWLLLIGILNATSKTGGSLWAQAAFCILWLFTYSLTVGPIAYAIIAETSSVRLRPLSVVLARNAYQLVNIVSQVGSGPDFKSGRLS